MSNKVRFYSIGFELVDGTVTDQSIKDFFEKLGAFFPNDKALLVRSVNNKILKCFDFIQDIRNLDRFIIPFGRLKQANKPYWEVNGHLEEIPNELFDINTIAYDTMYKILLITTNREGPSDADIEDYLNSFVDKASGLIIRIRPVMHSTGLVKVRNAQQVRSVTFNLNLGSTLNNFYIEQIEGRQREPLVNTFKGFIDTAKNVGGSKTLSIVMGLGHGKKEDTLDLESILSLLENINIEQDCVKEIVVTYKNGINEKVDFAKLKESSVILEHNFSIGTSQIPLEYLLNHCDEAIIDDHNKYRENITFYYSNAIASNRDYRIIREWSPELYFEQVQQPNLVPQLNG